MQARTLLTGAALAFTGVMLGTSAAEAQGCGPAQAAKEGEAKTISAQVVDESCFLALGLKGADHKQCAEICAKQGVPLVFLGEDGQLYLPVSTAMPSSGFNDQLVEHAEGKVKVTGKVVKKSGANAIVVDKVEAAS